MHRKNSLRELHDQWERGVELATEDVRLDSEPQQSALNDAAGLHIKSGVQGGVWTHTISCAQTCTCYE